MLRYISSYLKYKPQIGPLIGKANITVTITLIIIFAQFILKQCRDIHPNPGPQHVMSNNVNGLLICHANVNGIKDNLRLIRATLAGHFAGAYVASSLFVKGRLDLELQHIENMWLETRHSNFKFLLCVSYRPPNSSVDFWGDLQYQIDLAKSGNINHAAIVYHSCYGTNPLCLPECYDIGPDHYKHTPLGPRCWNTIPSEQQRPPLCVMQN